MGKTRGHGTRKGGAASGRSRGGRGGGRPAKDGAASDFESGSDSDSNSEKVMKVKKPGGQPSTAGMMPTDSDSEEEEQEQQQQQQQKRQQVSSKPLPQPSASKAATKAAGCSSGSEESSSGEEESSSGETESSSGEEETDSDDDGPSAHRPPAFMDRGAQKPNTAKTKSSVPSAQVMPAQESEETIQARKDLERLTLIRQKREQQRLERVAREGRDRFAAEAKS